jgi:hypothetical protein
MADEFIKVEVEGLEELQRAIERFPREVEKYLGAAGLQAANKVVLPTEGLKKYPPATGANAPPPPYYIRGRGTQYASGRNSGKSERYGTRWYAKRNGYGTEIGNTASYARWLAGDEQARHMAPKGWRKLTEVVEEKMPEIIKVYQAWVDKLLVAVGLK